jgi:hypothetical protein
MLGKNQVLGSDNWPHLGSQILYFHVKMNILGVFNVKWTLIWPFGTTHVPDGMANVQMAHGHLTHGGLAIGPNPPKSDLFSCQMHF